MPLVSIIIATCLRTEALEATLRSLAGVRSPTHSQVEVILVENGVQSGAEQLVDRILQGGLFQSVRYFFEPSRGKSRALNTALAVARGDILLFSDDDVRFPHDWIERMCEPILSGKADAVVGGVALAPHLLRSWMTRTHRAWLASTADYLDADSPSELCGANMALRRDALRAAGGFDPELGPGVTGGGEESLLSWQIKRAGYKAQGNLSVSVEHHPAADRLQYASWIRAAQNKGAAQAYLLHHWFHRRIRFPRIKRFWVLTKLVLRRLVTTRRRPGEEGISPWELSYVADCSMYERYQRERLRPRHYSPTEVRKIDPERLSGSA